MSDQSQKKESVKIVKAYARSLRIAPRKLRLAAGLVRNMHVADAMVQLEHSAKKAAPMVIKLIKSAVANAKNNFNLDPEKLFIKSITADMGQTMKRYFPRARGSAFVIQRKLSALNLVLEERGGKTSNTAKLAFLKKTAEKQKAANIDHAEAVTKHEVKEHRQKKTVKTDEQVKMNKVQNKRRLFNRKSGE